MNELDSNLVKTLRRPQTKRKGGSWHSDANLGQSLARVCTRLTRLCAKVFALAWAHPTAATASPDWNLLAATDFSLRKRKHEVLLAMCEDRGIAVTGENGLTKAEMTRLLLAWRDQQSGWRGQPLPDATAKAYPPQTPLLSRSDPSHLISALKISPGGDGPPTPDPTPTPPHAADESVEEFDSVLALDSLDLSDKRIDPSKIERGDKIGSGGYKDVYRGKYGRFRVAVSVLRGRLTKEDVKELGLLRDFKHPNVIRFIGVCIEPDCMSIVTEIAMNGDLFHYLRTVPCPAFLAQLELMLGSARGLLYLHNRLVVHRDIKSLNILVSSRGVAKLNDFGLSKVKSTIASMIQTVCGTINWQAPELWTAKPLYSFPCDVYALGLVFWEILTWHQQQKQYPFQGMNEFSIYEEVGKKRLRPSTSALRKRYGDITVNLLHALWAHDPQDRPPMADVVDALEWMIEEHKAGRLLKG